MRVAVVDSDLPYPPTSGKRLRSLHLMLPLAGRWTVSSEIAGSHGIEYLAIVKAQHLAVRDTAVQAADAIFGRVV